MKRTVAMLLCILLLLGLAACSLKMAPAETDQTASSESQEHTDPKQTGKDKPAKDGKAEASKDGKSKDTKEDKPAKSGETASKPDAAPAVSEAMRDMAGNYVLRSYEDNVDVYYNYIALENQRIVNGSPSGTLTLNEDGTGHLLYLDKESDIRWDEDSFLMDEAECDFQFTSRSLYIDTPDDEHIMFSKLSHLEDWNQSVLEIPNREVADASDYALGEPELDRYNLGSHNCILVRVPIENRSDRKMVLERLYFTTCRPDGTEIAFFGLAAVGLDVLLPGESGEFIYQYYVREDGNISFDVATPESFPEDAVIRIDEVDVFLWNGPYQRYEAEITEVVSFVASTGTYLVYRPNGYVELPEGTDIQDLYIHIYCYDKAGKIVGLGGQFACEESVNPVLYFEEIPGEHRARFQTNMNGPYEELNYPQEDIDHYVIIVDSPKYFY